ncbi:MAG: zf-HC2 domain-containing protein [Defluviitaleaceae bacterium]|nr:zf-HC2 domain-containing protein [Defluviitaleaceae bacterium]
MNISCDVIKDLLPLYHDDVCNESSRKIVEDHLADCAACRAMLEKIKDNPLDERIRKERENVIKHHAQAVRKKSLTVGASIALVLAIPVLVSLIVNLAVGQALDWFFIVLTSLILLASITVVPLVFGKNKGLWTLGSFIASLSLLLITISLYSGWSSWPFVAIVSTLLGLSILFGPYVLSRLPLAGFAARHKGFLAMMANTLLLYAVIIVVGLFVQNANYWDIALAMATVCLPLPWLFFLTIRYLKANAFIKAGLCFIFSGLFFSIIDGVVDWVLFGAWTNPLSAANLFAWREISTINANISMLVLTTSCIVGIILIIIGLLRKGRISAKSGKLQ